MGEKTEETRLKKTVTATLFVAPFYLNNRIFDMSDKVSNMNDCLYIFYVLKKKFWKYGIDLSTQDINPPKDAMFVIYNDMPLTEISPHENNYLFLIESKLWNPGNWDMKKHDYFKKIFTWDDTLVDGKKYIKINYSHKIPSAITFDMRKKEKLCALVATNKFVVHPLELYTERTRAIRWFEKNHLQDFDLYGTGWDRYVVMTSVAAVNRLSNIFLNRILYKLPLSKKLLSPRYHSYKCAVPSMNVLPKYKFAICYENVKDVPGYITEKIFNCFFSGCVPIYWGAPNITDYIPSDTFIDRRKFKTYDELYKYIKNMPDTEYMLYLNAIEKFITTKKIYSFSAECFAEIVINEILNAGQQPP